MRFLLILALIGACSSTSLRYRGVEASRQIVEGWTIDVYRNGDRAQAIRINSVWGARAEQMYYRASIAIERATGCTPRANSMSGDAALVNAVIRCP